LEPKDSWQPNAAGAYLATLDGYKDVVLRLYPSLSRRVLDDRALSPADALALGHLLEHYPRRVSVLEVSASFGVSALFFASHPKVSRVVSVAPNLEVPEDEPLTATPDVQGGTLGSEPPEGTRTSDVARAVLAEFGEEREKVELVEGRAGSARTANGGAFADGFGKTDVPTAEPEEGTDLVAFVSGSYTREGVRTVLESVFGANPHARLALLDGCRHARGPFVQAGVVDFMERAPGEYRFQLVGDLGPALARSNLGVLYPNSAAGAVRSSLADVGRDFSQRLDPLRLLEREEDLIAVISRANQELDELRKSNKQLETRVSRAEERNARLIVHYQSRRYKLTDAAAESALRVPGLRGLLRRGGPNSGSVGKSRLSEREEDLVGVISRAVQELDELRKSKNQLGTRMP
jgi:hypothetical protein